MRCNLWSGSLASREEVLLCEPFNYRSLTGSTILMLFGVENTWLEGGWAKWHRRAEEQEVRNNKTEKIKDWLKEESFDFCKQKTRRWGGALWGKRRKDNEMEWLYVRSSKRSIVAMAAPSLSSPWERLNSVAAMTVPLGKNGRMRRWK